MNRLNLIARCLATICCIISCGHRQAIQHNRTADRSLTQLADTISYEDTPLNLKEITAKIEAIDEVQSAHVGLVGTESENHKNFLALKSAATTEELVRLTDNKNGVVVCYSAMALADRSYADLKAIFSKLLTQNRQVKTVNGCIRAEAPIADELYYCYWNHIAPDRRATDKILIELDSVILYTDDPHRLLITRAIKNRFYKEPFKTRIKSLAFDKENSDALYYLCSWHRAEYGAQLKTALLKHLKTTDYTKRDIADYYNSIEQLLSFSDEKIRKEIISKMKKDRSWEMDKEKFKYLLDNNGIYNIDTE